MVKGRQNTDHGTLIDHMTEYIIKYTEMGNKHYRLHVV